MKNHCIALPSGNSLEALVAVWFGTTVPGAEASYLPVEEELKRRNPGIPLYRAYLSGMVRRRLGGRVPAPAECLKQLLDAGIRRVGLFSGLLTAGEEDPVGSFGKGVREVDSLLREAGVRDLTMRLYPGARHEILNEINRREVYADILDWLSKRCGRTGTV